MSDRAPLSPVERRWIEGLGRAEREIALLERVQPRNLLPERARLREAWLAGRPIAPDFRYADPPDLSQVFEFLEAVAGAKPDSLLGALCAERAGELEQEARVVEAVGTADLPRLARLRFAPEAGAVAEADAWAESWLALGPASPRDTRHLSDDAAEPRSLIAVL